MQRKTALLVLAASVAAGGRPGLAQDPLPARVEFNRDVRPILSDNCFPCHGPDRSRRVNGLRFDTREGAFADLGGRRAIVPGRPDESRLYQKATAEDPAERMPPAKTGKKLGARQVGVLRRWIEQGAEWQDHWSFVPPRRPALPKVRGAAWPRSGIDHFVLERLEREGLAPAREADRTTLIRRVTLDLTGLPPSPAEVEAFLADTRPDAYEKLVDRLLASSRYGERMAIRWLDAARYADTNGYQTDGERIMWRWRDWVIDAFNRNMPFDRFTIEQTAGDLLPGATLDQKIATGFHRNHRSNSEGGIIPEEYAVEYVVDRVETTATVWLGLTLGCARCHDHKYDPVTQREFYQLFAFFNNVPERGKAIKFGNSVPYIRSPTPDQTLELSRREKRVADAEAAFGRLEPALAAALESWTSGAERTRPIAWGPARGLVHHDPLDGAARGKLPEGAPAFDAGRIGLAVVLDGRRYVEAGEKIADYGFFDKFSLAAWVLPKAPSGAILSRMTDQATAEGYSLHLEDGRVQLNLSKRWLDDALRVETETRLEPGRWHHVAASYDGSRVASGIRIYVDGAPQKLRVVLDELNQSFKTKEPLRIGSLGGPEGRFHGLIDDVRVYGRVLEPEEAEILSEPADVSAIAAAAAAHRTARQAAKLRAYYLETHSDESIRRTHGDLLAARDELQRFAESLPTTMVLEEMTTPRETHVLVRGAYDKPGERVAPGPPACLPPLGPGAPANRLALARWLVDPANPLTARVTVNRFWQMYFGTGLVKTVEDFGAQGEPPSHPELLDWLAAEFVQSGWDVKRLQKTIVMSATYRQASRVGPDLVQRDPENRLLARGPSLRLSYEMLRDSALAAAGLLVEKIGGPSVRPYQPAGLWKELTGGEDYRPDTGEGLYRRSLYTFWKRTIPPPILQTFDAPARETCVVRESRTNTPLQALALLNDVTFVEAARALAERALAEAGAAPSARITFAFRRVLARAPRDAELQVLVAALARHIDEYRKDRAAADALAGVGAKPRDPRLDPCEVAAYTAVCNTILNLSEAITKE